ncbi:beta-ketoacyl-[acyl-carrier-protein] synthase family protein [Allostreptomyces psammosilenae]|uniref:3-oxoacyl-[acyl-carrier-protein] synthase II n=1 Tax=Allostreptomyces psammosilenae TaxID=1892865 RepID=A0A852ZLV8_9ACTN|nr:beta-ketoacyl-[acyl-carrier-protein] synthase family protein [Allostreptomyces psammosilenae]NYI03383.1 3-oxoacyl-[acyl-carrier-protein] synthase II [Allostreptomyces psammosilenae]
MSTAVARDVLVTGVGCVTPLGAGVPATWEGLLNGRSGVRRLTEDWADALPVRVAATAPDPNPPLPRAARRRLDRSTQYALQAAHEAWSDAGLPQEPKTGSSPDPERLGVVVASAVGGVTTLLTNHEKFLARGARAVSPHLVPMMLPNATAAQTAIAYGARAFALAPSGACASGTEAVIQAAEAIRSGAADVVLAGGAEAPVSPMGVAAFAAMRALATDSSNDPSRASRPFGKGRTGMVLGEGAGILVLEAAEHAAARGARAYCRIAGGGRSVDAYGMTHPRPDGSAAAMAMMRALRAAGAAPAEVSHINAHATGTPVGDAAEAVALGRVFGDDLARIPVTAPKSATGHLQAGAGAVETVITALSLYHRTVPPSLNADDIDDGIGFELVRWSPRPLGEGRLIGVSNSFGFGGHNAVVVLARE